MGFLKALSFIKPLTSLRSHTTVKRLLSVVLLAQLLGVSLVAEAMPICRRVFRTEGARLSENYQTLYRTEDTEAQQHHNFDLMGMLGIVYELKFDANTGKVAVLPNKSEISSQRRSMKARLSRVAAKPSPEFVREIEKRFEVKNLSSGLIMVRFRPDSLYELDLMKERGYALFLNRLFKTYENVVGFTYRVAGLESNALSSSVQMMVETKILQQVEKRDMIYQMTFDPQVWNKLLVLMEKEIRQVQENSPRLKATQDATEKIINVMEPLYPVAGVALSVSRKDPSAPVEIKRYFKNDYEDPLGLVSLLEKNDFRDRHEMLYETFKALPAGQKLEIHAHSIVHARAYMKLGFERISITENPLYPGVQVHELRGTREQVLEKIGSILTYK
jgi:hypothetical protein